MLNLVSLVIVQLFVFRATQANAAVTSDPSISTAISGDTPIVYENELLINEFSCTVPDFWNMTCTFGIPQYSEETKYECELSMELHETTKIDVYDSPDKNFKTLTVNESYVAVVDLYSFTIKIENPKIGTKFEVFNVSNLESAIPTIDDYNITQSTSNSFLIKLETYDATRFRNGIKYEIRLQAEGLPDADVRHIYGKGEIKTEEWIENLKYANHCYNITFRAKSNYSDLNKWSEPKSIYKCTKQRRPDVAPATTVGGFYINEEDGQLTLYWHALEKIEQNGPDFRYNIYNTTNNDSKTIPIQHTNDSSISLIWRGDKQYDYYYIEAENNEGKSLNTSLIRVYAMPSTRRENYTIEANSIQVKIHNLQYTISWNPPKNHDLLTNYTVFWCVAKTLSFKECKGTINFQTVNKIESNFTIAAENDNLILAIAANYPHYSAGMQWAECYNNYNEKLKALPIAIVKKDVNSITVRWNTWDIRICPIILKGFNLSYCQFDEMTKNCSTSKTIHLEKSFNQFTIDKLLPYTHYKFDMLIYSEYNESSNSDSIVASTLETAPTSPRDLKVPPETVKHNSVKILWSPPKTMNGKLKYYTVNWLHENRTLSKQTTETFIQLENLHSSTSYTVNVAAYTVAPSQPINITFETKIGLPSNPKPPTYNQADSLLSWNRNDNVDFYVVSLIRREKSSDYTEKTALVKENNCTFVWPECVGDYDNILRIRAVKMVNTTNRVDKNISNITTTIVGTYNNEEISTKLCENSVDVSQMTKASYYLPSQWVESISVKECNILQTEWIIITVIMCVAFVCVLIVVGLKIFLKCMDLRVKMPIGLDPADFECNKNVLSIVANDFNDSAQYSQQHIDQHNKSNKYDSNISDSNSGSVGLGSSYTNSISTTSSYVDMKPSDKLSINVRQTSSDYIKPMIASPSSYITLPTPTLALSQSESTPFYIGTLDECSGDMTTVKITPRKQHKNTVQIVTSGYVQPQTIIAPTPAKAVTAALTAQLSPRYVSEDAMRKSALSTIAETNTLPVAKALMSNNNYVTRQQLVEFSRVDTKPNEL